MRNLWFSLIPAIGSIFVGLPYLLSFYGPTEREVGLWGMNSLGAGLVMALLIVALNDYDNLVAKLILFVGYLGIALLQVIPILLWWEFHGRGISDGTPPSNFAAHWAFSLPHLVLLLTSVVVGIMVWWKGKSANLAD